MASLSVRPPRPRTDGEGARRARWAAVGAAVAISLGAGGIGITNAVVDSGERNVFVAITPCRLIDTRPGSDTVGTRATPLGSGETLTLQVTGTIGNCTIPTDATAVAANVVAVEPSAAGFFTLWPADVTTRPLTANLNFVAGAPPTPNKVDVRLSSTGQLNVFNFTGTAHFVLDVFGYYADHTHDDRYAKLDHTHAGVYQPVGEYLTAGPITMTHGRSSWRPNTNYPATVKPYGNSTVLSAPSNTFHYAQLDLEGPLAIGGRAYRLESVRWCLVSRVGPAFISGVIINGGGVDLVEDFTSRSTAGCYTVTSTPALADNTGFTILLTIINGLSGTVTIGDVTSTWVPAG